MRVPIVLIKFQDFELLLPTFPINVLYNIKFGFLTLKHDIWLYYYYLCDLNVGFLQLSFPGNINYNAFYYFNTHST